MKKLFVSVPMKGRTEEEIRKTIDKMKKRKLQKNGFGTLEHVKLWIYCFIFR